MHNTTSELSHLKFPACFAGLELSHGEFSVRFDGIPLNGINTEPGQLFSNVIGSFILKEIFNAGDIPPS